MLSVQDLGWAEPEYVVACVQVAKSSLTMYLVTSQSVHENLRTILRAPSDVRLTGS